MAHALHRVRNGLAVEDVPGVERDLDVEALLDQADKDLALHAAHQLHADFAQARVPDDMQLRILLVELHQLRQEEQRIRPLFGQDPIAHHRLEHGRLGIRRRAEALPRPRPAQTERRADAAGADPIDRLEAAAAVNAQLADLFLLLFSRGVPAAQRRAHAQLPARDLQPAQALALRVPRDLVDLRGKVRAVVSRAGEARERVQEVRDALGPQARAEKAGKDLPRADQRRDLPVVQRPRREVALHRPLVTEGEVFEKALPLRAEVDAALGKAGRKLRRQRLAARAGQIHLGHKHENGQPVALEKAPQGLGVRLHAVAAADDEHRVVQDLQRPLRLGGEVHMSRGVQQRKRPAGQLHLRLLGEDRDAPGPFQTVRIQKAVPVIDAPQPLQLSRKVQHGLAERGLPRVHMGQHAEYRIVFHTHGQHFNSFLKKNQRHLQSFCPVFVHVVANNHVVM